MSKHPEHAEVSLEVTGPEICAAIVEYLIKHRNFPKGDYKETELVVTHGGTYCFRAFVPKAKP